MYVFHFVNREDQHENFNYIAPTLEKAITATFRDFDKKAWIVYKTPCEVVSA